MKTNPGRSEDTKPSAAARLIVRLAAAITAPLREIEGEEHLPAQASGIIFVFNHNNYVETLVLAAWLLNRWSCSRIHFLVDWVFTRLPLIGPLIRITNPLPVYNKPSPVRFLERKRNRTARAPAVTRALDKLAQGGTVALFPEGTRNRNPDILSRGRKGAASLALQSQALIVPIGLRVKKKKPGIPVLNMKIGAPLLFRQEKNRYEHCLNPLPAARSRAKHIRLYLEKIVTHEIMRALAKLSGKHYPFPGPRDPTSIIHSKKKGTTCHTVQYTR